MVSERNDNSATAAHTACKQTPESASDWMDCVMAMADFDYADADGQGGWKLSSSAVEFVLVHTVHHSSKLAKQRVPTV